MTTLFITGASRGIGAAIARRFAKEGAKIVIASKTDEPHPKLPGTIHSVAREVEELGGKALAICLDVRDESAAESAIEKAASHFGGIDILVNNAGAISPTSALKTTMKQYDLMMECNVRAAFCLSKAAHPFLQKSQNPHIVNLSPPINLSSKSVGLYPGYTLSKYGMSLLTLALSEEFKGISVNSLWPKTLIATSAIETFFPKMIAGSRSPSIVADALFALVKGKRTGKLLTDEEILEEAGIKDFSRYSTEPGHALYPDLFL